MGICEWLRPEPSPSWLLGKKGGSLGRSFCQIKLPDLRPRLRHCLGGLVQMHLFYFQRDPLKDLAESFPCCFQIFHWNTDAYCEVLLCLMLNKFRGPNRHVLICTLSNIFVSFVLVAILQDPQSGHPATERHFRRSLSTQVPCGYLTVRLYRKVQSPTGRGSSY